MKKQEYPTWTFLPVQSKIKNLSQYARWTRCGLHGLSTSGIMTPENKIARQRQGVTSTLPPAAGDPTARCNRNSAPQGVLYPFRSSMAREFSALHGTTIACAVLFCFQTLLKETKSWKSEIRTSPFPPCAAWSSGWHHYLLYPATSSTAPAQSSSSAMT